MAIWRIKFFPSSGERNSPDDYIKNLSNKSEQAQIVHRLRVLSKTDIGNWPHPWIHKITDDIFQLTAGNNRIMYCLDEKAIIVLHACRKVKQKTHKKDI